MFTFDSFKPTFHVPFLPNPSHRCAHTFRWMHRAVSPAIFTDLRPPFGWSLHVCILCNCSDLPTQTFICEFSCYFISTMPEIHVHKLWKQLWIAKKNTKIQFSEHFAAKQPTITTNKIWLWQIKITKFIYSFAAPTLCLNRAIVIESNVAVDFWSFQIKVLSWLWICAYIES